MDQPLLVKPPYFDPTALRLRLGELWSERSGNDGARRAGILDLLKSRAEEAHNQAERQLISDGNGRRCAEGLAYFQDELIRVIYDFTVQHIYKAKNPSAAERMAIVATGGYGRGLMAPGSDIDLLFLLPYKQTAWGESVVEYMLYLLWDLGFKVGHATRTVDQCVRLAKADMTIRTALLDARLLYGEAGLFADFEQRFKKEVVEGTGREFIEAKLAERAQRYSRPGSSRYLVEPNVKESKGGLRDLHLLHWLGRYLHPHAEADFVATGVFTPAEYQTYLRCEDFLWTVRCHLHFETRRAEERLTFDVQPIMAERLGYRRHAGLHAVERFMKHYFLVAKDVGDLTRIVCSALEVKKLKSVPSLNQLLTAPLSWRKRVELRRTTDFRIENGRITVASRDAFQKDPVNLIRLFWMAERYNVPFHPDAIRLVRASLNLIDKKLRASPAANRLFLNLLTDARSPETALRRMNEAGVLGRFIPSFGRVVSMMQFNMYHHYTVDEHLIRSVGILSDIENGRCAEEHPVATDIIHTIQNRRALYVAMLLHDIAKGRDEDHSVAGARIAKRLGPRLGLTPAETETVSWLVEHHLDMSLFAQSRDLNDPKTIKDFAAIVQSRERLKLLLILTVADIRAVGPGVWNGWKGQLLRTLYHEVEPHLAGGHTAVSRDVLVRRAQEALRERLADTPRDQVQRFLDRHYPSYWLRTTPEQQLAHARLTAKAEDEGRVLVTDVSTDAFTEVTELTVFAPNHPRLLAMIAGSCSAAGANIVDAQISTTRDDMALDTVHLQREFDYADDEKRRARKIAGSIEKLLNGEARLAELAAHRRKPKPRLTAFSVEPQVVIDNTLSDQLTVIEINGLDRPGLLYDLTREIADMKLDIASAHIATFGEKAVDVFYVTDLMGRKITQPNRQAAIRERLIAVLDVDAEEASAAAEAVMAAAS